MTGFPTQVQTQMAPAVAGDFASTNPRFNVLAGPGALVAGLSLFVGRFCWMDAYDQIVNSFGSGTVAGLVPRNWQGIITTYLAEATMQVYPGSQIFVMNGCDMWVVNDGSTEAVPGQKAYARYADGKVTFAATGTPPSNGSGTASSIAAGTGSGTGSIAVTYSPSGDVTGAVLTIASTTPTLVVGAILTGTGVATGTMITAQLTGTPGGDGTYAVNIPQTVASTAISATYGILTVGGTVTGTFGVGDVIAGSGGGGVTAGTIITALGTGTGGAGTYYVSPTQTVTSSTITSTLGIETKWYCRSPGAPGELVKISNITLG